MCSKLAIVDIVIRDSVQNTKDFVFFLSFCATIILFYSIFVS